MRLQSNQIMGLSLSGSQEVDLAFCSPPVFCNPVEGKSVSPWGQP